MRISDWSSDVCSSDLTRGGAARRRGHPDHALVDHVEIVAPDADRRPAVVRHAPVVVGAEVIPVAHDARLDGIAAVGDARHHHGKLQRRSEEHTSELQSLMRISYAVFCLKKKNHTT